MEMIFVEDSQLMHALNLRKTARALREESKVKFDQGVWLQEPGRIRKLFGCGTTACMAGQAVLACSAVHLAKGVDKMLGFGRKPEASCGIPLAGRALLGLSKEAADLLFGIDHKVRKPEDAAKVLDSLADWHDHEDNEGLIPLMAVQWVLEKHGLAWEAA